MNRRSFLTTLSSACVAALSGDALAAADQSSLQRRVKTQLDMGVANGITMGAIVMVVQRGRLVALETAGYADLASKRPMRSDAIFDVRSISKPITVFGALLLVEQGKIALDAPLATYLPEFSHVTVKGQSAPTNVPITIRQMMNHTSGIVQQAVESITRSFDRTLADYVNLIAQQPLDFVPGTQWEYSSSGIAVLGRVIEVMSGRPFEVFMNERIFEPLEMRDSSFFTNPAKIDRIPTMYNLENGNLVKDGMDVTRPGQKYPAPEFGLFSTAEDLRHFGQMMLDRGKWKNGTVLSAKLIDEMTRPERLTSCPK